MNQAQLREIIEEELQSVLKEFKSTTESPLDEADSLGAGRTIEEVWQSLQDNAFQAHKDLQMLAIHLGNAKYTTQEVDDAVDTLEGMLLMLNQDVRRDVQGVVSQSRRGE